MRNVACIDPLRALESSPALGQFAVAHAEGDNLLLMASECLDQLSAASPRATLGFVYLSSTLIDEADQLLALLQRELPRVNWIGATVAAVMADTTEFRLSDQAGSTGAIAVMLGEVAVDQFRILAGVRKSLGGRLASLHGWRRRNGISGALVHGDAHGPFVPDLINELGRYMGNLPLTGGIIGRNQPGLQVAVSVISGGMSGVLFGRDVSLVSGRALCCSPIGLPHAITRMAGGEILEIDRRPALDVLQQEAGELLSRDHERLTQYVCPAFASTRESVEFQPSEFLSIDPVRRSFTVSDGVAQSGTLRFYRRDGDAAWRHFDAMLLQAVERTRGHTIRAGFFVGSHMPLGAAGTELAAVRSALGHFPLIGYRSDGDVYNGRRFNHTNVLTLLVD